MSKESNIKAFLELVRAGLWEKDAWLSQYGNVDFEEIMRLAEEQSVVGLVAAGIDGLTDSRENGIAIPLEIKLQFVGQALQIEQRNTEMNHFISELVERMRENGIYILLVKGQGIAQCYARPLWRASGDVDLLLSEDNYKKAKEYLVPLSTFQKSEGRYSKHLGLNIPVPLREQAGKDQTEPWYVELHGTLRTGLAARVDELVDAVQRDVFFGGNVRSWDNGGTTLFLPAPDNDVFFVFTHFIKHFYKEGMNLRQICDWCRLLWTYKDSLNYGLLELWIRRAGLLSEWKAFAALAVGYIGMPIEAMPLYDSRFKVKVERILKHILKGEPYSKIRDTWAIAKVFPWNTFKFLPAIFFHFNWLKVKERMMG